MNPYKSNINLFEEKTGRRIPEDISGKACVIYGKYAEGPIRELFKLDYPEYVVEHHEFRILRSIQYPFMQASLDGELTDQDGRRGILEIKTTNILRHSERMAGRNLWNSWNRERFRKRSFGDILLSGLKILTEWR